MRPKQKGYSGRERRRYIRLDTVLPIEFRLLFLEGREDLSDLLQGFTSNIGKGGLCLCVNNLNQTLAKMLIERQAKIDLCIEMPWKRGRVSALASVVWMKEIDPQSHKYLIGLSYEEIDPRQNNRIMRYAWMKKLFIPVSLSVIILFALGFYAGAFINVKLIKGNIALVGQLVKIVQESSIAKQNIKEINKEKEALQIKLQAQELRIQAVQDERLKFQLTKEKEALQDELIELQRRENSITEDLLRLDKKKVVLEKASLDKMYKWLKSRQDQSSGLIMSLEGEKDRQAQAFTPLHPIGVTGLTYDQALAAKLYTDFSDFPRAKKIFEFFKQKAKRVNGLFLNAYYAVDGNSTEDLVFSGPNIWLGIAILQYTQKSHDPSYLPIAEELAKTVITLQNQDMSGGIRAGPDADWLLEEHNLDAYVFFNLLYKITAKEEYLNTADKVLGWLMKHMAEEVNMVWAILALGPEKLEALGINPDKIIEFTEENCAVEVFYLRPEGNRIKVRGFDFARQKNLARGGVISCEGSAQMILAFKIMSEFYYKKGLKAKAHAYEMKADEYLMQLAQMIIPSPSPQEEGVSCLPYASLDLVDTGGGWITSKGSSSCSVAATIYAIFSYYGYNPLEIKD